MGYEEASLRSPGLRRGSAGGDTPGWPPPRMACGKPPGAAAAGGRSEIAGRGGRWRCCEPSAHTLAKLCSTRWSCMVCPAGCSPKSRRQRDQAIKDWEAATRDPDLQEFWALQRSVQERCRIRKDIAGNILCDNMMYWSDSHPLGSGPAHSDAELQREIPGDDKGYSLPPIVALAPCAHVFCKACLTNWISVCDERQMEATCLIENCREPMRFAVKIDAELLSKKLKEDHARVELEREERTKTSCEFRGNPGTRPPPTWISGRVAHSQM